MTDVRDAVLFISEEDDNSPVTGVEDSDDEDSESQTLYTVDDIEEGLRQFERQRHAEVTDQAKAPDSEVAEPISILEMVSKNAPVEEKSGALPNGSDRLYTIEDILEALEVEDRQLSLKDEQEKNISIRTEESKTTAKAMREGCRKRMKEEERRIRKRTWRKYSLDDLKSEKMIAGLSEEKRAPVEKYDAKEKLSVRLSQLGGDEQEQMTESEDKTAKLVSSAEKNRERRNAFFSSGIVKTSAASSTHESMGDVSKSLVSEAQLALDEKVSVVLSSQDVAVGDGCDRKCTAFLPERKDVIPVAGEIEVSTCNVTTNSFNCPLTEKTRRMVVHQRPHPTRCDIADVTRYEDGHKWVSHVSHSKYAKCQAKSAHGNGIRESSTSACNLLGTSPENADVRPSKNGRVPCQEETRTESDSHSRLGSEEIDGSAHEQDMDKADLNAKGKFRRFLSGFMRACRQLCCVASTDSSEE
ncbi:uncharacterized protein LOC118421432 [Branchiostoma floridae]|uniref:Uncharacterized protein LOC118421432 n=1 Tax=Branchiostoma floridae TaxID=7739 RepID=C3ZTD3_BRAFL|nr:uncharacterized protein LOC118421432 [Branchiostoma floridae]|eukprot:XP_002588169.1 hypothetical protein BRAFLDRAFT_68807 [Branchiostoma floridae]